MPISVKWYKNETNKALANQQEGYYTALNDIISQASTCEQIKIPMGNNQEINLIAIECLQGAGQ